MISSVSFRVVWKLREAVTAKRVIWCLLTYRCQLRCPYCAMQLLRGSTVGPFPEKRLSDWQAKLNAMEPYTELCVSGGEPSLLPWMSDLCNWALSNGKRVVLFSNLCEPSRILSVDHSARFRIVATRHDGDSRDRFIDAFQRVSSKHVCDVHEIGKRTMTEAHLTKPCVSLDEFRDMESDPRVRVLSADLREYRTCFAAYEDSAAYKDS